MTDPERIAEVGRWVRETIWNALACDGDPSGVEPYDAARGAAAAQRAFEAALRPAPRSRRPRKPHRLAAWWGATERSLMVDCAPRRTDADLRYLCDVLNVDVLRELERRGYDVRTLRFSIDRTPAAVEEHERRRAGRS